MDIKFSPGVSDAMARGVPVVALESTVIAHGLPYPQNLQTANDLESVIRAKGAVPATIAILNGEICVGLDATQIERLASGKGVRKISRRDLAIAVANHLDCATTVATTALIAHRAGIRVFATGGIGDNRAILVTLGHSATLLLNTRPQRRTASSSGRRTTPFRT